MGKKALIKSNSAILFALAKTPDSFRKKIITHAPNNLINSISECCQNVLKGNVTMTNDQTSKLKGHSSHIRQLANNKLSINKKKNILNKRNNKDLLSLLTNIIEPILKEI